MAIEWGAWEGSGYNRIRVGIDVSWENVSHGESSATATIKIYTDVEGQWSDSQTLSFGGAIGGSTSFTNNQDNNSVLRATKKYTYNYGSNEYGSSPGNRTFSASLSGAYNGATPSKSVSSKIPARPIASPAAPTNVSVSRVNDGSQKISWTNKSTSGEPWDSVNVDRDWNDNNAWSNVSNPGGGSTSTTDSGTGINEKIRYRVRSENNAGVSGWVETGLIFTTPSAPTSCARTPGTGSQQVVSWSNKGGYSEYNTQVWVSRDDVWTLLATVGSGVTSYTDTLANSAEQTKYRVRHITTSGVQGTLYSSYSNETSETAGVTTPPLTPTDLVPDGLTVDPTLAIRLSWVFQPGQVGDTQQAYLVRHRVAGTTTWTEVQATSSSQFYDIPRDTYDEQTIVEWTVSTKGSDPVWSPEADTVSFTTGVAAIAPDPVKLPVLMDLFTGQLEASSTAYEIRNLVQRIQSNLMGGGVRSVDSSYNISWTQRFIAISLGRSGQTFPQGYHDILSPFGWSVTQRAITSNRVTLTISVGTNSNRARVGDTISVTGIGAPYDGEHIVRETTTSTVKYDINPTADVGTTSSGGSVFCTIHGHGGASNAYPSSAKVALNTWDALYYELPLGWGSGDTPRKNGVVRATQTSLTSNVATITVPAPHYFAMGDRVTITGCGAPYDGDNRAVVGVSGSTIQVSITSANVGAASPASGRVIPSGKDTFFSNFHKVNYQADFVVPDNWILIAMRNGDAATVEWGTGDTVDPGYDSDSPVFKQAIFTSTSDVSASGGNKPPLRIGDVNGNHVRIDGNEIQSMNSDTDVGALFLNPEGGAVNISHVDSISQFRGTVEFPNAPTTTSAANCNLNSSADNRIRLVTSLGKYKLHQEPISSEAARGLLAVTPKTWYDRSEVEENDGSTEGLDRIPGFVAEEMAEHAPTWATFDDQGNLTGVAYDRLPAGLLLLIQEQQRTIESLTARVTDLENR